MPEGVKFEALELGVFLLVFFRRMVVASLIALACYFLRLEGSTCPLLVRAGKIHSPPSDLENRISRIAFTRGVIGIRRRALSVCTAPPPLT